MMASWKSHQKGVKILLLHGANPQLKDNDGQTALDWVEGENVGQVELLSVKK